jgi:hypothetical protein
MTRRATRRSATARDTMRKLVDVLRARSEATLAITSTLPNAVTSGNDTNSSDQ